MRVAYVAPYFTENTQRFLRSIAALEGVRLSVIAQEDLHVLPHELREPIVGFERVGDALAKADIVAAARRIAQAEGGLEQLVGVLEQLQIPVAEARAELGLPGLSLEVAQNFRDKDRMKRVLGDAGLPVAMHRSVTEPTAARAFADEVGYPIIVKPPAGVASQATFRARDDGELDEAVQAVLAAAQGTALLEEMVTGSEHSFDAFVRNGELLYYSITDYLPSCIVAMENPWIQWCAMLPRDYEAPEVAEVGLATLLALGLRTGVCHLEWFRRPDGSVVVSEVGARPGGAQITTMISRAHDVDYQGALASFMLREAWSPLPPRKYAVGTAFLRGQGAGRVRAVHGYERLAQELGGLVCDARLPAVGQEKALSYEGEGYVVVRHPDDEVVRSALSHIISNVRVELG